MLTDPTAEIARAIIAHFQQEREHWNLRAQVAAMTAENVDRLFYEAFLRMDRFERYEYMVPPLLEFLRSRGREPGEMFAAAFLVVDEIGEHCESFEEFAKAVDVYGEEFAR